MNNKLSNHILEVRFRPSPRFLDEKGHIAAHMTNDEFNHWNISSNRIDFSSSEHPELAAFFSFSNLGVTSAPPASTADFLNTVKEYIKSAWQHFEKETIIRMGVRSKYLIEVSSITKAFNAYKNKFLKLSDDDITKFGGELVDVGFPLNFIAGDNFFNVNTGSMEKKQSEGIFGEKAFEAGIYVEVDYFRKEISPNIIVKHVISFVNDGTKKADSIANQIVEWINS